MALIDRESLKANIIKMLGISGEEYLLPAERAIWNVINAEPPVQPKRGKWIPEYKNPCYNGYYKIPSYCSCCKDYYTQSPEEMKFCPNCGADMRGNADDEVGS